MKKITNINEGVQDMKNNIVQYLMVALIVVGAYMVGVYKTKVEYLEGGGGKVAPAQNEAAVGGKYESFDAAMTDLAQQIGLDEKEFEACLNNGDKAGIVASDLQQGEDLGVRGTPAYYVNGKFLGGAFPANLFEEIIDRELAGKGSTDYKTYSDDLQNAYNDPSGKIFDPVPKEIEIGNAPIQGGEQAKVVIVEFSDFQCPYCQRGQQTMIEIMDKYGDEIQMVFKHFPLSSIHPHAQKAGEAAECAKDQGKFWEMHDALFAAQTDWSPTL